MADRNDGLFSDVTAFFSRLQGQDRIRKGKSTLTVLDSPETPKEREQKQKILSLSQYVRNKNWNRRHVEFFDEYRKMVFTYPIIKAAIDIYGEEVCTTGDDGNIFSIKCENEEIKKELENCYFKQLKLNTRGFLVVREICKFGNVYGNLITRPRDGVVDVVFFPPETVMREQMYDPGNLDAYRFLWYGGGGGNNQYEPWEIVHWKNSEDIEMEPYGSSILRPILDTWRRIVLMREALVIYRITRAPSKLLFKIGTDGMTGEEAFKFAQNLKKEMTKKPLVNPQTGEIDFKYNPMPVHKDTPIPLLDGRVITIEELSKEQEEGKQNFVYAVQDSTHQIVPGKVSWCGKNYTAEKLIRVWLDNESYLDTAPEHPFVLRNGSSKRADELGVGDSLMPFYQDKKVLYKGTEYHRTYNPSSGSYEFTHHIVAKEINNPDKHKTRHHVDFNRFNNNPTNIQWVDFKEHKKMHGELAKKMWNNVERREIVSSKISQTIRKKTENGYYASRDKNSSEKMKNWWRVKENYARKVSEERERMINLYSTEQGDRRREVLSIAAKKVNQRKWDTENRENQLKVMSKICDDYAWTKILTFIKENKSEIKEALEYINQEIVPYLNTINTRDCSGITINWLNKQLKERGFSSYTTLKTAGYKNHKVSKIEVLENMTEDVYCMTVVGLNGENDRHNFAALGLNTDKTVNLSGVFVKNSIEENVYMPTYEGSPSDVSVLEGAGNLDAVEDYKIIKDDLFAGLKIPKSFLSFEEDLSNKAALSEEDVRFSRTVQRIQQSFAEGILHIGIVHLFLKGYSKKELESFTIEMNNPSTTAERKKIELIQARLDIAKSAWDTNNAGLNLMSYVGVLKDILKFTDEEIQQTIKAQITEKKIMWRLEQLRTNGTYEDPEIDKKLAQMKGLTGTETGPIGFDNLEFEGATITEIMRKKVDQELREIFKPVHSSPTKSQINQLTEGSLVRNLKQAKKDMDLDD